MTLTRRAFSRSLVAKLSDLRERFHILVERADAERAREADGLVWTRELGDAVCVDEVARG